jgi:hypothetical protein
MELQHISGRPAGHIKKPEWERARFIDHAAILVQPKHGQGKKYKQHVYSGKGARTAIHIQAHARLRVEAAAKHQSEAAIGGQVDGAGDERARGRMDGGR